MTKEDIKLHAEKIDPSKPMYAFDVPNDAAYMVWTGTTMDVPNISLATIAITVTIAIPIFVKPKADMVETWSTALLKIRKDTIRNSQSSDPSLRIPFTFFDVFFHGGPMRLVIDAITAMDIVVL